MGHVTHTQHTHTHTEAKEWERHILLHHKLTFSSLSTLFASFFSIHCHLYACKEEKNVPRVLSSWVSFILSSSPAFSLSLLALSSLVSESLRESIWDEGMWNTLAKWRSKVTRSQSWVREERRRGREEERELNRLWWIELVHHVQTNSAT